MRPPLARTALATLLPGISACVTGPGNEVLLPITAIHAPATVHPDSLLRLRYVAQGGGCVSANRFESQRTFGDVHVSAIGIDASGPGVACTADVRFYEGRYATGPDYGDSVVVHGRQPDGSELRVVVRVGR
ncbi:MAG: hypothetical protein JWL60_483 [Gemmatimonadetes bacterium]|jgi:hypothetical protein|nr:hypothetical protein [Gemmatimonadota bacterium]